MGRVLRGMTCSIVVCLRVQVAIIDVANVVWQLIVEAQYNF